MEKEKLQHLIVNVETGEEILVDYTPEEIEQHEQMVADYQARQLAKEAEMAAQAEAKASALAKLTALGLTEEEAKAIVG